MDSPFSFAGEWQFTAPPDTLWATLATTDRYREWWPWIVDLSVEGAPLAVGSLARFVIQAPLPYRLRCTARVVEARPPHLLVADVEGDLTGPARLELEPTASGSNARLAWTLEVQTPLLRALARVARPAMAWGHDRIVARGLAEFETRALGGSSVPRGGTP